MKCTQPTNRIFDNTVIKEKVPFVSLKGQDHAMNLLIAQKDTDALNTIAAAIRIQPNDSVNRNIESIVRDVIARRRKRPSFEETIQ